LPHLRAAADAGHAVAASLLATYHLRGWGLEPDPETALSWRQRSAELGYPSAMRILCYRYAEGDGVAPDMDTAIGWCERAAAQDELIAFSMLAGFYREGRGVPRDVQEAARLFRRGAEVARAQAEAMPGDEYALNMQGWYVYEANRLDMDAASIAPALAALDRALALEPHMLNYPGTDADTILAGFLDTRAHLRDQAGDAAGALADYRAAMDLGGTEQISAYQTGLTDAGHFDGETDGTLTPALIAALEACIAAPDCDPLPQ